ncbi:preprotein translocase subunit SecE [Microlunatus ginsengisoli]|uniref:Protein translocase subunit SecE n=1 Tax=Microlunatus ginsengisoli TaxID=363863 RepID=A0ABP6ZTE4_9ACTN
MATDDERDPDKELSPSDSAADATADDAIVDDPRETGAEEATADLDGTDDEFDDELEIDDPDALERATEQVSDADDDVVSEPTNAELAELTEGSDASAKAGADSDEPVGDLDENGDGDRELVGVGAGTRKAKAKTAQSKALAEEKSDKKRTDKKGKATPKRDGTAPAHKRTGPVTFVKESVGELRKVVYPTGPQLLNYFIVVLIFVLFIIAIVSVLDLVFGWAILKIFS